MIVTIATFLFSRNEKIVEVELDLCLHCFRFVPESFRWYVSHNRTEDAERVIRFIGRVNGYKDVDLKMLHEVTEAEKQMQKVMAEDKKYTVIDVLRHPKLLKYTLLLAWIW